MESPRVRLGRLNQPNDVPVRVPHGRHQLASAGIFDLLLRLCASVEQGSQALLDVVNVPVATGPVIPASWPLGSRPISWSPILKPT